MAWRLFRAVQAGGMNGEGDKDCIGFGIAGNVSFMRIDLNDGQDTGVFFEGEPGVNCGDYESIWCSFADRGYPNAYLSIEIPVDGNSDPLERLDAEFRDWAEENNCH